MCGGKQCCICANGGGGCLSGRNDDYAEVSSPEEIIKRLDKNKYPYDRDIMISYLKSKGIEYQEKDSSYKVKEYEEKYADKKHYTDPDDKIAVEFIESVKSLQYTPVQYLSGEDINKFIQLSLNYIKSINGFPGAQEVNSIIAEAYADAIGIINYALENDLLITREEPKDHDKFVEFANFTANLIFDEEDPDKEVMCEVLCRKLNELGLVESDDNKWIFRRVSSHNNGAIESDD